MSEYQCRYAFHYLDCKKMLTFSFCDLTHMYLVVEIHWMLSCLSSVTEFPPGDSDCTIAAALLLRCVPANSWSLWPRTGFLWCFTWGTHALLLLLKGVSKQQDSARSGIFMTLKYSSCLSWICISVLKQVKISQFCWN